MRKLKVIGILVIIILAIIGAKEFIELKNEYKKRIRLLEKDVTFMIPKLTEKYKFADIDKAFNYKSLPIEKISNLDFISDDILSKGKAEMAKHKAVFVGITRDDIIQLPEVLRHIEYIGRSFADYRVIVFENDSTDATRIMLNIWKMINPKVQIISKDFFNKKRPSIKFMADCRNEYLNELKSPEYDGFDIVIPIDMDMSYGIDVRGMEDSFSKIDRWDMVCSNGIFKAKGKMWDAFAFRSAEFPDSPESYKQKYSKNYWAPEHISAIQKIYAPESDLVPVYSCFGGMAIYKRQLFEGCSYDSIEHDCEHVALHECMRNKHRAKIFMNPAQMIRYQHYKE